jgi:hypothetical protein
VAAAAAGFAFEGIAAGRHPLEHGEVDRFRDLVCLFRQLAKRGRSLLAHHAVGKHPGLLLGKIVPDAVPALLEMVPRSNTLVIVARAAGLPRTERLIRILAGQGIDDAPIGIPQIDGSTGANLSLNLLTPNQRHYK